MAISLFDIPAIVNTICQYISHRDILSCTLVCHEWKTTFTPNCFKDIHIHRKNTYNRFISPPQQEILRAYSPFLKSLTTYYASFFNLVKTHQSHVQSSHLQPSTTHNDTLTSYLDLSIYNTYRFNNITTLRALSLINKHQNHEYNCTFLFSLLDFIETCKNLVQLEISFFKYREVYVSRLGNVIENHPSLKDFTLNANDQRIFNNLFCQLVQHCRRLERLDLCCTPVIAKKLGWIPDDQDIEVEPFTFSRSYLKEINLQFSNFTWVEEKTLLPLLSQCPDLERFDFPLFSCYYVEGVCDIITNNLNNLKHVSFESFHRWNDRDVSAFIESCAGVTPNTTPDENGLRNDGLGGLETFASKDKKRLRARSIISLVCCHRITLQHIDVQSGVDGSMMELILRSCPNLTTFMATIKKENRRMWVFHPYVAAAILPIDIWISRDNGISCDSESSPSEHSPGQLCFKSGWVCTKLRVLGLQYSDTENEVIPKELCVEISKLRCLEKLQLTCIPQYPNESELATTKIRLENLQRELALFNDDLVHLHYFELNNHDSKTYYKTIKRSLPRISTIFCRDY